MTYANPVDIREAVAPDGNSVGTCAELSDDQLQRALQKAQDRVDASVGDIYPDDSAPNLLRGLVIALGSYYATLTYRKSKDLAQFDPVYLLYQDAIQTLTDIKNGVINPTPTSVPPQTDPYQRSKPSVVNPMADISAWSSDDFALFARPSPIGSKLDTGYRGYGTDEDWTIP